MPAGDGIVRSMIGTITRAQGLAIYDVQDFNENPTYFEQREAKRSYSVLPVEFKASYQPGLVDDNPEPAYQEVVETDSNGNEYQVRYVPNYGIDPIGYHVWKSKPNNGLAWDDVNANVSEYITFVAYDTEEEPSNPGVVTTNADGTTAADVMTDYLGASTGYNIDVESILNFEGSWQSETEGVEFYNSRAVLGIFGIPYQFMPHVDPRLDVSTAGTGAYITNDAGTGREYAKHILEDMPVLFISPGFPNFMTNFSKGDRNTIIDALKDVAGGLFNNSVSTSDLMENSGKYYTFEYAVPNYYQYVNPACRIASAYMGIPDKKLRDSTLETIDWQEFTLETLGSFFSNIADVTSYASIPFYIESDAQISESFSNDVTDSSLTSMVDSVSDIGREAMFILGYGNAALAAGIDALNNLSDPQAVKDQITNAFGSLADGNGFLSNIIGQLSSVATGGRLIFPKIWSDSSFSRSYDVTIKLRSPDMDPLSLYCNIIVPFLHLLCLMLPRQIEDNPNGFYSPFIVRAIYKGFFNIDMGIITSMSVTKGDTGQWTADGIPTSMDISLSIADLYENMSRLQPISNTIPWIIPHSWIILLISAV